MAAENDKWSYSELQRLAQEDLRQARTSTRKIFYALAATIIITLIYLFAQYA